jgi:CRISPR type I-E-associated protein CasA/Cse1
MVTLAPFAKIDGRGYKASINGSPPVYVLLIGETLFETLAWNLVLPNYRPSSSGGKDQPTWRGDSEIPASTLKRDVGLVAGLSWQPRRIQLLPGSSGLCSLCGTQTDVLVHESLWAQGHSRPKDSPWWRDPFVAYTRKGSEQPRGYQPRDERALWRDYAILFLPSTSEEGRYPAAIVEQTFDLLDECKHLSQPEFQCFAYRTKDAKILEWQQETLPFSPRLRADASRTQAVKAALTRAEESGSLLRQCFKKLYPRGGMGNHKAFEGLLRECQRAYWSALAEPFRRLVIDLDTLTTDADTLDRDWSEVVRRQSTDAVESIIDSLDANAEALQRAALARRVFYGGLKKKLPRYTPV